MRPNIRYAIVRDGKVTLRALPTRKAADAIVAANGGKVIIDPRSVRR
jgi:hypothetical protein